LIDAEITIEHRGEGVANDILKNLHNLNEYRLKEALDEMNKGK
jgi:hypothetical protein